MIIATDAGHVEEARRLLEICNACRYCEGLCATFQAMASRRSFADADVDYLANLCHNCTACYHDCQYAPPHDFDVNVPVALADVRRGIRMFRETEVPVLGVIENMAYYQCPCCGNEDPIFARGGGQRSAERYGVPFLGEVPIDPRIRQASDEGEPFVRRFPEEPAAKAFLTLADNLIAAAELIEAHG